MNNIEVISFVKQIFCVRNGVGRNFRIENISFCEASGAVVCKKFHGNKRKENK